MSKKETKKPQHMPAEKDKTKPKGFKKKCE